MNINKDSQAREQALKDMQEHIYNTCTPVINAGETIEVLVVLPEKLRTKENKYKNSLVLN